VADAIPLLIVSRELSPARSKESLITLIQAFQIIKRKFQPFFCYGIGLAVYINSMIKMAADWNPGESFRALYLEDDIIIPQSQKHLIAKTIQEAEANDWNMITNYTLADGRNVLHHADMTPYTDAEVQRLKFGDKIELSGMGFYYGRFFRDYRFHEGDYSTQDWTFFKEKQVELHYTPIVCQHFKVGYY
jgi:hypothetical protein